MHCFDALSVAGTVQRSEIVLPISGEKGTSALLTGRGVIEPYLIGASLALGGLESQRF